MLKIRLLLLGFLGFIAASTAQPTNNPIEEFYPGIYAWTNQVNWANVHNITNYGGVGDSITDNVPAFNAACSAAFSQGGGVVFFPPGVYYFSNDIIIKDGVVLRGQTPSLKNAKDSLFRLQSRLVFPKYNHINSGTGTDNATAFKKILTDSSNSYNAGNIGLVYLDINRAMIELGYGFEHQPKFSGRMPFWDNSINKNYIDVSKNKICFGLRINNGASPDPGIPRTFQNGWTRWPYRFDANIHIAAFKNVLVANNRINDKPTDNFDVTDYKYTMFNSTVILTQTVKFDYTSKSAIHVNVQMPSISYWSVDSATAPWWFRPGITIRDNWIYRTKRDGIQASGWGLLIKDNIVKDSDNKFEFINPDGRREATGMDYNGNRSIWIRGGKNIIVEGNDVQGFQQRVPGNYLSNDGEGIVADQQGSTIDGCIIRNNKIQCNWFGLYDVSGIKNVILKGNTYLDNNSFSTQMCLVWHKFNTPFGGNKPYSDRIIVDSNIFNRSGPGGQILFQDLNTDNPSGSRFWCTNNVYNNPNSKGKIDIRGNGFVHYSCNVEFDTGAVDNGTFFLLNNCIAPPLDSIRIRVQNANDSIQNVVTYLIPSEFGSADMKLLPYPNPSDGYISLQFTGKSRLKIQVKNASGELIKEYVRFDPQADVVDFAEAPPGIYILRISGGEFKDQSVKVLKR